MKAVSYCFIAIVLWAVSFGCKNEPNSPTTDSLQATFVSINPSSGRPNDTVTIVGKNLISDSVKAVFFNVSESKIVYVTDDSIRVVVPQLASGSYLIKYKTKAKETESALEFKVLPVFDLPKLSTFFPKEGMPGTHVTLKGSGFGKDKNISVYFGDSLATIISSCNDSICVLTPSLPSGNTKIKLRCGYDELAFTEDFLVLKKPLFYSTNKVAITISSLPVVCHYDNISSEQIPPPGWYTIDSATFNADYTRQKDWAIRYLSVSQEKNIYKMVFGYNPITSADNIVFEYDEVFRKIKNINMNLTDVIKYDPDFQKMKIEYELMKISISEADVIETDSSMIITLEGASLLGNLLEFDYEYNSMEKYSSHSHSSKARSYRYLHTITSESSFKIEIVK